MPLHLDPKVKGKWIKIGQWTKLDDILGASVAHGGGKHLVVRRKGKPNLIYRGNAVDHVKGVLDREGHGGP